MAITRAQQAKQMLQEGGMTKKIKGQEHMLAYITPGEADKLVELGGQETMTPEGIPAYPPGMGDPNYEGKTSSSKTNNPPSGGDNQSNARERYITDYSSKGKVKGGGKKKPGTTGKDPSDYEDYTITGDDVRRAKKEYEQQFYDKGQVPPLGSRPTSLKTKLDQRNKQKRLNYINRLIKARQDKIRKGLIQYQDVVGQIQGLTDFDTLQDYIDQVQSVDDLVASGFYSDDGRFAKGDIPDFTTTRPPGVLSLLGDKLSGPVTSDRLNELMGEIDTLKGLRTTSGLEGTNFNELMETYEPNRFKLMNPEPGGRDDDPILPILPTDNDDQTTPEDPKQILSTRILGSQFDPTFFAADGGIANLARQELFLGGIVKGVKKGLKGITRGIKKVAKSPLGKIALAAAAGGYGFGLGPFKGMAGSGFLKGSAVKNFLFKDGVPGLSNLSGKGIASIIGGASLLPLLMSQKEDEFDIEEYYRQNALNPNAPLNRRIAGSEFSFADGGSTEKEPVAKKTMPLLDMGGQEMDLRAEGGFVPIGRMEKADDVPARLSKNEFVFTAEAVRNAGDGDVDKGAEVMYNMMKNLEDGGDVSEESQGLEGARNMFQTSQRLGEVL